MIFLRNIILSFLISFSAINSLMGQDMKYLRERLIDLNGFHSIKAKKNGSFRFSDFETTIIKGSGSFKRANKRPTSEDIKTDLLQLTLYFEDKKASSVSGNELDEIKLLLYRSLNYWLHDKPQFKWTDSAFDQPRYVAAILLSLYDDLDKDRNNPKFKNLVNSILANAANYVRYSWNFGKSSSIFLSFGEDLDEDVQRMGNVGYRLYSLISIAAAIDNPGLVDTLSKIAKNQLVIKINSAKNHPIALMPDFSFHQHNYGGSQIYNLGYGLDWFKDFVSYAYYTKGTKWALTQSDLKTLVNFLEEGLYPFFLADGQVVEQVLGRHNQLPRYYSSFPVKQIKILRSFFEVGSLERRRIDAILEDTNFTKDRGHRGYYTSDLMLTKTENYAASVKFISTRTSGQESGDNGQKNALENFFFSDGSFLLYKKDRVRNRGAWDWRMVPGTTTELIPFPLPLVPYGKGYSNRKSFAGILEAEHGLLGSFNIDRTSPQSTVTGVKSYALLEDLFLFEGHNIRYTGKEKLVTTVAQEQVSGRVILLENSRETEINTGQTFEKTSNVTVGVWHDNVGYLLIPGKEGELKWGISVEEKTTRWQQLDSRNTMKESLVKVFSLNLVHGISSTIEFPGYLYLVLPDIGKEDFKTCYNNGNVAWQELGLRIENRSDENLLFYYKDDPYFMNYRTVAESNFEVDSLELEISGLIAGTVCGHKEHLEFKFAQLEKRDDNHVNFTVQLKNHKFSKEILNNELADKIQVTSSPYGTKIEGNTKPKNMLKFGSTFSIDLPPTAN